jgi:hypothetical protein
MNFPVLVPIVEGYSEVESVPSFDKFVRDVESLVTALA